MINISFRDINISYSFENVVPYYLFNDRMNPENSHKGFLGEWSFREGCEDYLTVSNIEYSGKHDIDNIVFTSIGTVINESKNINKDFKISYSWFLTHILDRFLAYPIAQYYARLLGYPDKTIFLLTIPSLKCDKKTELAIKGIGIKVLQTNKQVLNKKDVDRASSVIRRKFLSVLTNSSNIANNNIANKDSSEGNMNSMLKPKISQKTIVEYLDFDTYHRHIVDKIKNECQSCKYYKLCKHFAKLIIYEDIKSKQDLLISGYYLGYAKSRRLKCLKCLEEKKLIIKSKLSVWQSNEYLDDEDYMEKIEYIRQTHPEYNPKKVVYYASPELSYVFNFSEYNVKYVYPKELEPSNLEWNIKKRHKDKLENNILKRDKWNYQTL
jgi:hypothetical protein